MSVFLNDACLLLLEVVDTYVVTEFFLVIELLESCACLFLGSEEDLCSALRDEGTIWDLDHLKLQKLHCAELLTYLLELLLGNLN